MEQGFHHIANVSYAAIPLNRPVSAVLDQTPDECFQYNVPSCQGRKRITLVIGVEARIELCTYVSMGRRRFAGVKNLRTRL